MFLDGVAHIAPLIEHTNDLEQHGTILEQLRFVNTPEALDVTATHRDRVCLMTVIVSNLKPLLEIRSVGLQNY